MSGVVDRRLWGAARLAGLLATAALLVALVLRPEVALTGLWKLAIPLVPASLLVSPKIWRNVCPLATVSMAGGRLRRGGPLPGRWAPTVALAGIALFALLVPARRFLFDREGAILAVTIVGVGLLAFGLGAAFDAKGGFCNALCPVLPVERLYGQSPILEVANDRCDGCSACSTACIDLSPRTSLRQAIGRGRGDGRWTSEPLGGFAAAFPGFVAGYFTSVGASPAAAPWVYAQVLGCAALSWVLVTLVVRVRGVPADRVLPLLGALAVGAYYAFAATDSAAALGLPPTVGEGLRVVLLAGVLAWWLRADRLARVGRVPTRDGGDFPTAARRAVG